MPDIRYQAGGFPASTRLGRSRLLPVSWPALARAAVSLGCAPGPWSGAVGPHGVLEMIWRVAMVRANLMTSPPGTALLATDEFWELDPAEKGAVSFFLGQVSMKVFADRIGVCCVARVDQVMRDAGLPVRGSRPDFYGHHPFGGSVAVEVKGRSHPIPSATMVDAEAQAGRLPPVLHSGRHLAYAHAAYFSGGEWHAWLDDPAVEGAEGGPPAESVLSAYYRPLAAMFTEIETRSATIATDEFVTVHLPAVDLTVGLRSDLLEAALSPPHISEPRLSTLLQRSEAAEYEAPDQPGLRRIASEEQRTGLSIGRDGVLVLAGENWSDSVMSLSPSQRHPARTT